MKARLLKASIVEESNPYDSRGFETKTATSLDGAHSAQIPSDSKGDGPKPKTSWDGAHSTQIPSKSIGLSLIHI